jgi:dienelactone hydrolase
MATPTLTHHAIPGRLGEILVDLRSGSRSAVQPAVLLVHGFKGFKDFAFLPTLAERLAREGFAAITVSVSGSGVDAAGEFTRLERFGHNTYSHELDDLHTVVDALLGGAFGIPTPSSLGVVGHSRGGGMALLLTREEEGIGALVTWNAIGKARRHSDKELALWKAAGTIEIPHARLKIRLPLSYDVARDCLEHEHGRLDILAAASALGRPWLQLHGTADETVAFDEATELARVAGGGHELIAIEGGAHTFGASHPWQGGTPELERAIDFTAAFFGRHLD